jgi:hydrogenase maturation protein HypF
VTTSAGRLFDGLSALITHHSVVSFEAQAAVALEELAWSRPGLASEVKSASASRRVPPASTSIIPTEIDSQSVSAPLLDLVATANHGPTELDWGPLFFLMLEKNLPAAERALAAHIALAQSVAAIAELSPVVPILLTGGCFQNRLLTELAERILSERGRMVYIQRRVPPNDGGISLGQAVAARWASSPDFAATNNYIRTYPAG